MNRPNRWSYSSLSTYKECPAKYKFSYLMKTHTPGSPAMARGTRLHGLCEDYMVTPGAPVHYDVRKIGRELDRLRTAGAKAEQVWLADKEWTSVTLQTQAWVKAIVDVHYLDGDVLHLYDYKSGREYPTHRDQLELYSILGLLKYPEAKRAESGAIYIDGGYTAAESSIIRAMLPPLIAKWDAQAKEMETDEQFIPSPGSACRWCPYKATEGGPCIFG